MRDGRDVFGRLCPELLGHLLAFDHRFEQPENRVAEVCRQDADVLFRKVCNITDRADGRLDRFNGEQARPAFLDRLFDLETGYGIGFGDVGPHQ